ncbi:unnamed protein product [Ambrosiozyma monospora]|uniref:Unnamed protein product n=1 Tax=Ambrosiozyma monospora TaxID=43982 RepID=A0A9W7DMD5_AMBMO|nr:unnamed protein product [Ambrosiozyma monospora]
MAVDDVVGAVSAMVDCAVGRSETFSDTFTSLDLVDKSVGEFISEEVGCWIVIDLLSVSTPTFDILPCFAALESICLRSILQLKVFERWFVEILDISDELGHGLLDELLACVLIGLLEVLWCTGVSCNSRTSRLPFIPNAPTEPFCDRLFASLKQINYRPGKESMAQQK